MVSLQTLARGLKTGSRLRCLYDWINCTTRRWEI